MTHISQLLYNDTLDGCNNNNNNRSYIHKKERTIYH